MASTDSREGTGTGASRQATLYATSGEALKAVRDDFHYWTGRLTENSFQLSIGVIGANWAAFGSLHTILASCWAKASLSLVLANLAFNALGAKWMSELHGKRVDYATEDITRWEKECNEALGRCVEWPFTASIVRLGRVMRELKTWLPLMAGAALLIGILIG
jgi:hypothetical protein